MEQPEMEPILTPSDKRLVLFPIQYPKLYDMYKKQEAMMWKVEEIDFSLDKGHYEMLEPEERESLDITLANFAVADGAVMENIAVWFYQMVQIPEARNFYAMQLAVEGVHNETYSKFIEVLISDLVKREKLFESVKHFKSIAAKMAWVMEWIANQGASFAERLLAFAAVEGIMFASSFCMIFWLKKKSVMPGLTFSNELISRDESLHFDFACLLMKALRHLPSREVAERIIRKAVEIECQYVDEMLKVDLAGMNKTLMKQYVKFVADRGLISMGYNRIYKVVNPFAFMEMVSLDGKSNFFERRVSEYGKKMSAHINWATSTQSISC